MDPTKFSWRTALGTGGYGSVFKVWDHASRQHLAIKRLDKEGNSKEDINSEIMVHRLVDGVPGFPRFLAAFEDSENWFFVMVRIEIFCSQIAIISSDMLGVCGRLFFRHRQQTDEETNSVLCWAAGE
jgi:serine/threonine protein kinase